VTEKISQPAQKMLNLIQLTTGHLSPKSYQPSSPGAKYALFVIFASRSSVSRLLTSGPVTTSSSQSKAALCNEESQLDFRALRKASKEGGLYVVKGMVREIVYEVVSPFKANSADCDWETSENATWASEVTACSWRSSSCKGVLWGCGAKVEGLGAQSSSKGTRKLVSVDGTMKHNVLNVGQPKSHQQTFMRP
jgi:hypothetical protein